MSSARFTFVIILFPSSGILQTFDVKKGVVDFPRLMAEMGYKPRQGNVPPPSGLKD